MSGRISLGLVSEFYKDEYGNFDRIKTDDWQTIYNFFVSKDYDVKLFDWKDLDSGLDVKQHLSADIFGNSFEQSNFNLNNLCDVVYIGQLGNIHDKKNSFQSFLDSMESFNGITINPIKTIKNNLSKQYLVDLYDKGFRVVPSKNIDPSCSLSEISKLNLGPYSRNNLEDIVLKPKLFGEKGEGVRRLSDFSSEQELRNYFSIHEQVIAQPFLKEIEENGENSYLFVNGEFSHGLNKSSGKFKVNEANNAVYTPKHPSGMEMEVCEEVLSKWPEKHYYARIDIIYSNDKPLINEFEMVNPAAYLEETNSAEIYLEKLNSMMEKRF